MLGRDSWVSAWVNMALSYRIGKITWEGHLREQKQNFGALSIFTLVFLFTCSSHQLEDLDGKLFPSWVTHLSMCTDRDLSGFLHV